MRKTTLFFVIAIMACAMPLFAQCSNGRCTVDSNPWQAVQSQQPQFNFHYATQTGHYESVVRVCGLDGPSARSYGSGCAIKWGGKVVILTAGHVIRDAKKVLVRGKTAWCNAQVLHRNSTWDVAILAVDDPDDFTAVDIDEASVSIGDNLESCGFGPDDKFAVNSGSLKSFSRPYRGENLRPDWMNLSGRARQGDSGGPVFRNGKLVGVLWGTRDNVVVATQTGQLHQILNRALGSKTQEPAQQSNLIAIDQTQLLDGKLSIFCKPQQQSPQPQPAYQPPQVNVQADPRVGDALVGINGKLDQVVANTAPTAEVEPDKTEAPPIMLIACVIAGVIIAFIFYYIVGKN